MYYKITDSQKEQIKFIEEYVGISFNAQARNASRAAEKFINKYLHKAQTIERVLSR